MGGELLIRVDNVSKKFCRSLKRSMLHGVRDILGDVVNLPASPERLRPCEFWAVRDLSFEVRRGECIGVVGRNGAGKSTLLKMLNGIFLPDRGSIAIEGRVGALIEVGAGFHPMLTGRENVYLNGAILGMDRREVSRKFDAIVDFAELREFMDTPVKNYSSGMFVRLGFSIAVNLDVDILLVDEALSVGDLRFKAKCYDAIGEFLRHGAVVFVSHNMTQITRICDRVCYLDQTRDNFFGPALKGVQRYNETMLPDTARERVGNGEAKILEARIEDQEGGSISLPYGSPLVLLLRIAAREALPSSCVIVNFRTIDYQLVAECNSLMNGFLLDLHNGEERWISVKIEQLCLNPGTYLIDLLLMSDNLLLHYDGLLSCLTVNVEGQRAATAPQQYMGNWKACDDG